MSEDASTISGTPGSVFGIDLGTTFSCIAYIDKSGNAQTIPSTNAGNRTTPSVVYVEDPLPAGKEAPEVLSGYAAQSKEGGYPKCIHRLFKRRIAEKNADIMINGKAWTPTDFSAEVLKGLVKDAKTAGFDVHDVVITHPAYFSPAEIEETKKAGELAGLNVISMLPEPVAAALFYGIDHAGQSKTILVYDLGGGTFDATLVRIGENKFKVLDWAGRKTLGGADWDEIIFDWCVEQAIDQSGATREDVVGDPDVRAELASKVIQAKIDLSTMDSTTISFASGAGRHKIELPREKFDELTAKKLAETREFVDELFKKAKAGQLRNGDGEHIEKVDDILLVGGSTLMRQVPEMAKAAFAEYCDNEPMYCEVNEAVAKGAALKALASELQKAKDIEAGRISEENPDLTPEEVNTQATQKTLGNTGFGEAATQVLGTLVNTVTESLASRSFGLVVKVNGIETVANLIIRGEKLPCVHEESFPLENSTGDAGGKLPLKLYSSDVEEELVDLNNPKLNLLDTQTVDLPPKLDKGSPIGIRFELTAEGLLKIRSVDEKGNVYNGSVNTNQ